MSAAAAKYLEKYKKVAEEEQNRHPDAELRKELGPADHGGLEEEEVVVVEEEEQFITAKQRRQAAEQAMRAKRGIKVHEEAMQEVVVKKSLLDEKVEMIKMGIPEVVPTTKDENIMMLEDLSNKKSLMSVQELANDVKYTEPMKTDWRPPKWVSC